MNIFDLLSGKDDVERLLKDNDLEALKTLLKSRKLLIPRKPQAFLDASGYTKEQLAQLQSTETSELAELLFEPWILEKNGVKKLPVFSSEDHLKTFSARMFVELNQVFALGNEEMLLSDVVQGFQFQFVCLNLYSEESRELDARDFKMEDTSEEAPITAVNELDDLELVATEGNFTLLKNYLKSRRVLILRKPQGFLDAMNSTAEQFAELLAAEGSELNEALFEPWIFEENGVRKLPVFSSLPKMERFSEGIAKKLNKVFVSGHEEMLLWEATQGFDYDLLELNPMSEPNWVFDMKPRLRLQK